MALPRTATSRTSLARAPLVNRLVRSISLVRPPTRTKFTSVRHACAYTAWLPPTRGHGSWEQSGSALWAGRRCPRSRRAAPRCTLPGHSHHSGVERCSPVTGAALAAAGPVPDRDGVSAGLGRACAGGVRQDQLRRRPLHQSHLWRPPRAARGTNECTSTPLSQPRTLAACAPRRPGAPCAGRAPTGSAAPSGA